MITVAGEALIDIVVGASGSMQAVPGGGPFNVARTIARLGGECQFLGTLSEDPFGQRLRSALRRDGVRVVVDQEAIAPTAVAIAQIDELGVADYRFYIEGTAAAQLERADVPADLLQGSSALAVGGLGLVVEPIASTLRALVTSKPSTLLTLLDPNCRPRAVRDPSATACASTGSSRRLTSSRCPARIWRCCVRGRSWRQPCAACWRSAPRRCWSPTDPSRCGC